LLSVSTVINVSLVIKGGIIYTQLNTIEEGGQVGTTLMYNIVDIE